MFQSKVGCRLQDRSIKKPAWKRVVQCLILLVFIPAVAYANTLESIKTIPLSGNKLQVILGFSTPPAKPLGFTVDNPALIALDLKNTHIGLPKREYSIDIGDVRSLDLAEAGNRTRLVFNLNGPVPYETRIEGNNLLVTLGVAPNAMMANTKSVAKMHFASTGALAVQSNVIQAVNFTRGKSGDGLITLRLSNPNQAVDVTQRAGKIVVIAYNSRLPKKLQRRMIVTDFGTPVDTIDARQTGRNTEITVSTHGQYKQIAYQVGHRFTLDIQPLNPVTASGQLAKPEYTGQRISLNFQNIPIRSVLQLLADFTGLNIVVSDQVKGNVTLRLKNVPWDQALALILQSNGLAERRSGNVILIAPANVLQKQEQEQIAARKALEQLAPLHTEIFQIRYAKATEIASLLKQIQSSLGGGKAVASGAGTNGVAGLTARGSVVADTRTNTLIVRDTSQGLADVAKLIQRLDVPVKQVLIAARIVNAQQNFSRDLGVNFGVANQGGFNSGSSQYSINGNVAPVNGTASTAGALPGNAGSNLFSVNLPAAAPTSAFGFAIAKLGSTFNLNLEISAAEQEGIVRDIANPRVITANDQQATITSGVQIPYQQASSSGATNVSFKTAALELQVTPHITPNDRVLMNLTVSNDSVGNTYSGVPSINTQAVTTQVMVDNGQTLVLGGVYQDNKSHTVNKVPFFGDLPVIGNLFKENINKNKKSELLIFITPKIINSNLSLAP